MVAQLRRYRRFFSRQPYTVVCQQGVEAFRAAKDVTQDWKKELHA